MSSPIIKKDKTELSFYEALKCLVDGSKITRTEWENPEIYGFLNNGIVSLRKEGSDHQWIISDGDILANDWILIN